MDSVTNFSPTPRGDENDTILEVSDIAVRFGGIIALDGVSFNVRRGIVQGLIGPNGAGKTTLFNCLSRLYIPNQGDIRFQGKTILNMPPHQMAEIGIGRTFQNLALFKTMTVLDNIMVGVMRAAAVISSPMHSGCRGCRVKRIICAKQPGN